MRQQYTQKILERYFTSATSDRACVRRDHLVERKDVGKHVSRVGYRGQRSKPPVVHQLDFSHRAALSVRKRE